MSTSETNAHFGQGSIEPTRDIVAGQYGTWRVSYTAGSKGLSIGSCLRVYTDSDTDWEFLQFVEPTAADYATVESPPGVQVAVRTDNQRSLRMWIQGRDLQPGEQISLVIGDTSGGGPGSRSQTFAETNHYFWMDVDERGSGQTVTLDDPPCLTILGDVAEKLVLVAPSTVAVGESFEVLVKAEDRWGNPSNAYGGAVSLAGEGVECTAQGPVRFAENERGAQWVGDFKATHSGLTRIEAADNDAGLRAQSNPIRVSESRTERRLYWADPHGGQLVLNEKFADFFRYARDVAGIQFVGFQRNADVISERDWEVQQQAERELYAAGRFVPIPGFEWSGATWEGGHHNIYFRRHNQAARRNAPAEEMFQADRASSELTHIVDVYRAYRNSDVIITPHVGGHHSNLTYHEPTLEPAVEIVSSHGMFEWMMRDALRRGYQLGFLGGSDSYTGRPGDDRPGHQMRRYSKAGLTGIYARDVTLESFHEAMRARRVYATTGARMILHTESDGHELGSGYTTSKPPTIKGQVVGTTSLQSVELFRGLECIHKLPLASEKDARRIRLIWRGGSRMMSYSGIVWDGRLTLSGARLCGVETLRFDSPRSHITEQTDQQVRWHAWGCGYPMGLELEIDAESEVQIQVAVNTRKISAPGFGGHGSGGPRRISLAQAENATLRVSHDELLKQDSVGIELGVIDCRLDISLAKRPGPPTADFEFTDDNPQPGVNPYWIRVVQSDLETGWTSPVFVDFCPAV